MWEWRISKPVGMGEARLAKVRDKNMHVCLGPSRKKGHTGQHCQLLPFSMPGPEIGDHVQWQEGTWGCH